MANLIISPSAASDSTASRSEPAPLSAVVVTVYVAAALAISPKGNPPENRQDSISAKASITAVIFLDF